MTADVDYHSTCSQLLGGQHPEQVVRLVEIAEFVHQPLGVQGPSFAKPRIPDQDPVGAGKVLAMRHHGSDLKVMSRKPLVIGGGHFGPEWQLLPLAKGVPDATGPREVFRWRQVVRSEGGSRRNQVDRHVSYLGRYV